MSSIERRVRYATVTAGSRLFLLMALVLPVALAQHYVVVVCAILLAVTWMGAIYADGLRLSPMVPLVVEGSLVALLATLALEGSTALLVALVAPPFVAGLVRGARGAVEVVGAEIVVCLTILVLHDRVPMSTQLVSDVSLWLAVGLGLGLIGERLHRLRGEDVNATTSYRDARQLIVRLQELSDSLVAGLDPVAIGQRVLLVARRGLPLAGAVVYAPTDSGFTPLIEGEATAAVDRTRLLDTCLRSAGPVVDGAWVAVPLVTDAGVVAILAGNVVPDGTGTSQLRHALDRMAHTLRPHALQLDTALLFASVRDHATADERRRLARELHDGVAQDLASLGYLIDDLAESTSSDEQRGRCDELRGELGRVVAELRRSLFVLRNEGETSSSLGAGVRALATHLESRSDVRMRVEVTEGPHRLRPEVESELLRIAQEGMTNAMRHSHASLVEVLVDVRAPAATVVVRDDGQGLLPGRDDSHGIRIMQERAHRIGAVLTLCNRTDAEGAELRVTLGTGSRIDEPGRLMEGTAP